MTNLVVTKNGTFDCPTFELAIRLAGRLLVDRYAYDPGPVFIEQRDHGKLVHRFEVYVGADLRSRLSSGYDPVAGSRELAARAA